MDSFYSKEELTDIGLKSFGENVLISRKCSIYGASRITIGDNVRIDDFCILSGLITIGSNIHISAFCALYGAKGIELCDYTGLSPRSILFSAMDDFGGDYLIGPVHDFSKTNVQGGRIILNKYSQMGANTIVFPNVEIGEGAVTGAFTLVTKSLDPWTVNVGIPSRIIRRREQGLLKFVY